MWAECYSSFPQRRERYLPSCTEWHFSTWRGEPFLLSSSPSPQLLESPELWASSWRKGNQLTLGICRFWHHISTLRHHITIASQSCYQDISSFAIVRFVKSQNQQPMEGSRGLIQGGVWNMESARKKVKLECHVSDRLSIDDEGHILFSNRFLQWKMRQAKFRYGALHARKSSK